MSWTTAFLLASGAASVALLLRGLAIWRIREDRERLADHALLRRVVRLPSENRAWLRAVLVAIGVGALVTAASGVGSGDSERPEEFGSETVLLLDASNSMLAEDVPPSRLGVQRAVARRVAARLPGKIAVVYFAGRGYVLSPLTTDVNAVHMFVDAVRPASVGRGGSALAAGVIQALDLLAGGEDDASKRIVLFSDGEETVGQPTDEVIRRAQRSAVRIHTVGVGTRQGGPIPLSRDAALDPSATFSRRRGDQNLRDSDGEVVITRLEEASLRTVAEETGGVFVRSDAAGIARLQTALGEDVIAAPESRQGAVGALLLLAFALLWGEAFFFRGG